jgi:hypothetical protein
MISDHDLAELRRSASEASKIRLLDVDLERYPECVLLSAGGSNQPIATGKLEPGGCCLSTSIDNPLCLYVIDRQTSKRAINFRVASASECQLVVPRA